MIQSLLLEFLNPGALPIYQAAEGVGYHILEFGDPLDTYTQNGRWRAAICRGHRLIVPLNIDTDNNAVFTNVPIWVNQAQAFQGEGTLIFIIRTAATFNDGTTLVLAGMAYSEQPIVGAIPLEGISPAELIVQLLHNNREHPIVIQALERADAEAREHRRYWIMSEEAIRIERKKERQAEKRATKLLDRHLTHKQRRQLRTKAYIEVRGQDGNIYRIERRSHQNVFLVEEDRCVAQFCVVSSTHMPVSDLMLAQKLLLETSIEHFMKLANKWDLRGTDGRGRVRVVPLPGVDIQLIDNEFREILEGINAPPPHGPPVPEFRVIDDFDGIVVQEPIAEAV